MALIQWKQLSPHLSGSGNLTGSLNVLGNLTLNGQPITAVDASIFSKTGSYASATTDVHVTGSFKLKLDGVSKYFAINVDGDDKFKVNEEGVVVLHPFSVPPTPITGSIYYGADNAFYFGL